MLIVRADLLTKGGGKVTFFIFTVKGQQRNLIQFIDHHVSTEKVVDFKCFPENNLPRRVLNKVMVASGHAVYFGNLGEDFD